MSDIVVRALKTFIQAFFGTLLAEGSVVVSNIADWTDLKAVGAAFAPIVIAALSAGISALWNYLLTKFNTKESVEE